MLRNGAAHPSLIRHLEVAIVLKLGELATVLKADLAPFERDLRKAKQKFGEHKEQMKAGALAAGAAIGAALGAGLMTAVEQSKTTALLSAQLGAGTPMAAEAGKAAGAVYARGVVGSMEEASAAVKAALQNALVPPGSSTAAIDAVAAKVANLSAVMQEDAERVSAAVSTMLKTGMAKNAQEAFDMIQRGVETGLNKSGDLLDSFNEYPSVLKTIGLNGRTTFGLVQQGLKAGAKDSDKIVDALKELSLRAVNGSKSTSDAFKTLGLDASKTAADVAAGGSRAADAVDKILDKIQAMPATAARAQVIQSLFGGPGEDLGAALFALDVDEASEALDGMAGASDRAGKALEQSAGAKLQSFKVKVQQALIEKLGQAIPYVEKVFGFIGQHASIIGPLAVGLGIFATAIYAVSAAMKVWAVVQTVMNLALWTSPITWIVLGVVALVAVIVLIATKTDLFGKMWAATWDFVTGAFKLWWSVFSGFWTAIGGFFVSLFKTWWGIFTGFWSGVFSGIATGWKWVTGRVSALVGFIGGMPKRIRAALSGLASILMAPFKAGFNAIARLWNGTVGRLSFRMPGWVPGMGGKGFSMPHLPQLARGGTALAPGLAVVGERGPELAYLGRGATVQPLPGASGPGGGGPVTVRLTGELRARGSDLVLVLRDTIAGRGGNVQAVVGSNS